MTTDFMTAFSIEEGDTLLIMGNYYVVSVIDAIQNGYRLHLTDEEGFGKIMLVNDNDKIRVVVEND
jgi:hypothetical protein